MLRSDAVDVACRGSKGDRKDRNPTIEYTSYRWEGGGDAVVSPAGAGENPGSSGIR